MISIQLDGELLTLTEKVEEMFTMTPSEPNQLSSYNNKQSKSAFFLSQDNKSPKFFTPL